MANADDFTTELAKIEPWNQGPPRINGPRIFGAGVDSAFFLPMPVTGERPITFTAEGLPEGLSIDTGTGLITGLVSSELEAAISIDATNASGSDSVKLRVVVGGSLALTPPLGWNSWNCWGAEVNTEKIRACADAMVSSGLAAHGYSYVNIDDGWQGRRSGPLNAIQGNEKFSDMKGLCEYVHSLGLRIGIYSTPFSQSYSGYTGGSSGEPREKASVGRLHIAERTHEKDDAEQWAKWGFDYLKYDWNPWRVPDVEAMAGALKECGRDMVYSLSNSARFDGVADWARLANCWRTTGDITDTWENMSEIGFSQDRWTSCGGPGHWNDPDMLVVGRLGWGNVRENRLTVDEQITHMTLWAVLASPLLMGCDLTRLDDPTLRLLCNDEVLAVNQDPLGRQGHSVRDLRRAGGKGETIHHESVYVRELADESLAAALFNRGPEPETIEIAWSELGIEGPRQVRDLWARKDLGSLDDGFSVGVPAHGAQFIRISPA